MKKLIAATIVALAVAAPSAEAKKKPKPVKDKTFSSFVEHAAFPARCTVRASQC